MQLGTESLGSTDTDITGSTDETDNIGAVSSDECINSSDLSAESEKGFSGDRIFVWILYSGAVILATLAVAIYIYSGNELLSSKYVPSSLDVPCMSMFFLLSIILFSLGHSIELSGRIEPDTRFQGAFEGVTDKVQRLKDSNVYDRKRLNHLSYVDGARRRKRRQQDSAPRSSPEEKNRRSDAEEESPDQESIDPKTKGPKSTGREGRSGHNNESEHER